MRPRLGPGSGPRNRFRVRISALSSEAMGFEEPNTLQDALTPAEIAAANELTRRWFAARAEVPAVASGLGVWPLLAALATGAVGETREELLAAAGIDIGQAADIPRALLAAVQSAPALRFALAVWAGAGVTLDPDWVAGLPAAAVGSLTGDTAADQAALDAWVSRSTDGLIDRMPIDLDDSVLVLLASALSLRTKWITPFEQVFTPFHSGPWAGRDRCEILTATFNEEVLRVGEDAAVLLLPGRDDIDVLLGLGREDLPPQEVMSTLIDAATDPHWGRPASALTSGSRPVGVEILEYEATVPQTAPETEVLTVGFVLSSDLDLLDDAAALGLELAADQDRAQFHGLAAERFHLSQAKQTCTAVFSESGFEAAAVTAFGMAYMGFAPPQHTYRHVCAKITVDRPFAYLARHRPSGLVLVGGWVAEPAERDAPR